MCAVTETLCGAGASLGGATFQTALTVFNGFGAFATTSFGPDWNEDIEDLLQRFIARMVVVVFTGAGRRFEPRDGPLSGEPLGEVGF